MIQGNAFAMVADNRSTVIKPYFRISSLRMILSPGETPPKTLAKEE
jgi:hypothetical protein